MSLSYFHRVAAETPTRFWANNPTAEDMELAIEAGAINCTTNPSYCSKLLEREPDYLHGLIDGAIAELDDDDAAAERVYDQASLRIMRRFMALYEESEGACGYVTMQGDPRLDDNPQVIIDDALRRCKLSKNYMAKIPVTVAGARAIEELVAHDMPLCATEIFSLAQAIYTCEMYQRATEKSGKHPPFYVTHITGIFDQHLADIVQREGIDIDPDVLGQAGCAVARKQYALLKERGYEGTMLGGGARGTQHFTEMVGGDIHVTINWSTAQELIETDPSVVSRIDAPTPQAIIDELSEKFPVFRQAYVEDGLAPEDFEEFGPLVLFRNMFLDGYGQLLEAVRARRKR